MKKKCSCCKAEKELEEFYFRNKEKGTRMSACSVCVSAKKYNKAAYLKDPEKHRGNSKEYQLKCLQENREKLKLYFKTHHCVECGESDLRVLQCDHLDEKTKSFGIAQKMRKYKWEKLSAELEKCQVMCGNCHIKRTSVQFGWWRE